MADLERVAPNTRNARPKLSLGGRSIEPLLAGCGVDGVELAILRAVCKKLTREASDWEIARRRAGLFGTRTLNKQEADRALKAALAEIGGAK